MKWHECVSCTTEFRVVSDSDEPIEFCPYCGYEIVDSEDDDEDEDEF